MHLNSENYVHVEATGKKESQSMSRGKRVHGKVPIVEGKKPKETIQVGKTIQEQKTSC
jgi:hypothetical protein